MNIHDFLKTTFTICVLLISALATAAETDALPKAFINGTGEGWVALTADDFVNVNGNEQTWTWQEDGTLHCNGKPTSVMRYKDRVENFEMVCQWRHLQNGGNSGIFVWAQDASIEQLAKSGRGGLPAGIEVQVLDLGYAELHRKRHNEAPDWFTCHGDVFSVGSSTMEPFPPIGPVVKGRSFTYHRSFPSKNLSKGINEWNHYYIRCLNGEVRLWVNGEEVSGGKNCKPASGFLCLESEGAPIDFKDLRLRILP